MPIEIIPKPLEKPPIWLNILFYISIGILIAVILSYFLLGYFQKNASQVLDDVEVSLQRAKGPAGRELEKNVLEYQKKIDDFSLLIRQHRISSSIFPFLGSVTHPQVRFSNFNLIGNNVSLSGEARDFIALGQQFLIFENNLKIYETELSGISSRERTVGFKFDLTLSPEIFEF